MKTVLVLAAIAMTVALSACGEKTTDEKVQDATAAIKADMTKITTDAKAAMPEAK